MSLFRKMGSCTVAVLVAASLSSCAGGPDGGDPGAGQSNKLQITMWDSGPETRSAFETVTRTFRQEHPGVTVNVEFISNDDFPTLIKTRLAGGSGPALYGVRPNLTPDLVQGGFLAPLQDETWFGELNDGAQDAPNARQDDNVYATPVSQRGEGVLYNRRLFTEAGISTPPRTFEELVAASKKLKAAGTIPIGMSTAENFWPQFLVFQSVAELGGPALNDDLMAGKETFADSDAWRTALADYKTLVPYFMPDATGTTATAAQSAFLRGEVAMWPTSGLLTQAREAGIDVGYFNFPGTPTPDPENIWGGYPLQLGINPKSPGADLAKDYLDVLYSDQTYQAFLKASGAYPVLTTVDPASVSDDPLALEMQEDWEGKTFIASPADNWVGGIQDALLSGLQNVTAGRTEPDTVLQDMDSAYQAGQ